MKLMVCIRVFKFMMIWWLIFHKCEKHSPALFINYKLFFGFRKGVSPAPIGLS
jgi:hypothetical protein